MKYYQIIPVLLVMALSQLGCQTATARAQASVLSVQSHTASDLGFAVNSHLIMGAREAILVDAQFTRSEARKVSEMIRLSGRSLKAIFITHGHPDHYLGLEILAKNYPEAKLLATDEVIKNIRQTAAGKLAYWKPIYKDDLADNFILPTSLKGSSIELEGEEIKVLRLGPGESENGAALYLPSLGVLVAGDLIYNKVHLWLAEVRPEGWLKNIESLRALGTVETILPGHGPAGDKSLLEVNKKYIRAYMDLTAGELSKAAAIQKLEAAYPDFKLPVIAELSVSARLK